MSLIDLGTIRPGTTLYIPFATYDSNDPSASVTITGLATTDIEVYKNGSTTQRSSDSGYALLDTDGIDFDSTTGVHGISIDLADNTDAGFYASGGQYWIIVASITVDAATVNFIAATFRIGYPDAILNTTIATLASQTSFTLTNGPAEDDALNGFTVLIHDVASAVQIGRAVVSDYTGSTKTVTLTAATTFTAAATDNVSFFMPANAAYFASLATSKVPLAPTTAGRDLDVSASGGAGLDFDNIELSNGQPKIGIFASGTLTGTHSTTTADLGTNAPSVDISGKVLRIPVHGLCVMVDSYNTGTGVATFSPATGATLANGDAWYVDDAPLASTAALPDVNVKQISGDATAADNAEAFFDGTGYAGTNNVIPTVTTVNGLANNSITAAATAADFLAELNAELLDVLSTDTFAEPSGVPAATASIVTKLGYLYMALRNRIDITATKKTFYDDGGTAEWEKDLSDDGTTYSESEGNAI